MSPLEILLIICLLCAGTAIFMYEKEATNQREIFLALNRANVSLSATVDSQAVALDTSLRQAQALRIELMESVPDIGEDAAVTFNSAATEAIAVTRDPLRYEVEAETGSKVWA